METIINFILLIIITIGIIVLTNIKINITSDRIEKRLNDLLDEMDKSIEEGKKALEILDKVENNEIEI